MIKPSLINAQDAIRSYKQHSSLSASIHQALIEKPEVVGKLIRIAVDPERENVSNTSWPLLVCQILQTYPKLLSVLFSKEGNADGLFEFLGRNPNPTQIGYFMKIVSLFQIGIQQQTLRYLKENDKILMLCFHNIHVSAVYRFLFDCIILCQGEPQTRRLILIKLYKEVIIQPSEDLAESIKDTLQEFIDHFGDINKLKQTICNIFDSEYLRETLHLIMKSENTYLVQGLVGILTKVIDFYDKVREENNSDIDITNITSGVNVVLGQLPTLLGMLVSQNQQLYKNQQEQSLPKITILKLRLCLIFKSVVCCVSEQELIKYDFRLVDLFKAVVRQLCVNPWANLIHNELTNIALEIIAKRPNWDNCMADILKLLIHAFKNRKYIFLSSGNTTTYGNTHHLYLITKKLALQLEKCNQLDDTFNHFNLWRRFLVEDLKRYELEMETLDSLHTNNESTIQNLVVKISERHASKLINQVLENLNDPYITVVDETIWDKRKSSYTRV